MESAYFDSSPFIAIFKEEDRNEDIRELLRELKKQRVRISTSIITIQEVSVLSYRFGTIASDNYVRVNRLARIEGLSKRCGSYCGKARGSGCGSERESDETATFTQLSSPAELRGTDVGHRHPLGHG